MQFLTCIRNWCLKEDYKLLTEAEAGEDGNCTCQAGHQHTLTQLLQVVPDRHL